MQAPQALTGRRFTDKVSVGRPLLVAEDFPAQSRFHKTVRPPSAERTVLKSGQHNPKIGGRILKGRWSGFPVFTLTLEERATCPRSCERWRDCYGNRMHWARRLEHGDELEQRLDREVRALAKAHPRGFVVRLHVLGDFYSVAYVRKWARWLRELPALNVYGYTAHPPGSPIGWEVARLRDFNWSRFSVRTSDGNLGNADTVSARDLNDRKTLLGTVCPMQVDATDCCATCGLCWQSRATIVFLAH